MANLHVKANINSSDGNILITNESTGHTSVDGLRLRMNSLTASILNLENGDLIFSTNSGADGIYGTPQIWLKPTGGVGIGTSTPGAKLEVAGQVKITGGSPGLGKILTSDGSGLGTWEAANSHNHYGQTWSGNSVLAGLAIQNNSNTNQAIGIDVSSNGTNNNPVGVRGITTAPNGVGVFGWSYDAASYPPYVSKSGVVGISSGGNGIFASSLSGYAIYGLKGAAAAYTGTVAYFENLNTANTAPVLKVVATGNQPAVDLNNGFIKVSGTNKTAFTITGTAGNSSGYLMTLNYANQSSTDIVLVTHNFNPGGLGNTYHNSAVGVYWAPSNWYIYSEDQATPMLGKSFNVLVIKQ